jgi:ATPase subunit of ABC transporter with duplicated ATPase domains
MSAVHFNHVSFSYSSAVPIIEDASFDLGPSWTGLVGANGEGKTTLLSLITGSQSPASGSVSVEPPGLAPVLCEQRVDSLTSDIESFAWEWDRDAVRMRASLELDPEHLSRWDTLSPGERKRWQIGAALVAAPDVLLLDEPTNHLDADAKDLLVTALASYKGCGVVVSHDRRLLIELTMRTLRIANGQVTLWGGSYDDARSAWEAARHEVIEEHSKLKREQAKAAKRLGDQRRKAEQKDAERLRIRRNAGIHDLDARGAIATGRHAMGQKAGSREREATRSKLEAIAEKVDATSIQKDRGGAVSFDFAPANKEFLLRYNDSVTVGDRILFDADVALRRTDRIRISGVNGAGKTSLLRHLVDAAAIPNDKVLYLAQETTAPVARVLLDQVRSLPADHKGRVMSLVALLGADPSAILASNQPSPGEARKVALALGLGTPKWLLVLDEPTNHLDLPSIERLEQALLGYEGALLLITHDDALAQKVTDTTWEIQDDGIA